MLAQLLAVSLLLATQKAVVPAFFPLNQNSNGTADWTRIVNAGSGVLAVVPLGDSGGFETLTGTSLTNARTQFGNNSGAGQKVLGYVDANFSCTDSSTLASKLTAAKTGS